MSKIEEALKKARQSRTDNISLLDTSGKSHTDEIKELVRSNSQSEIIQISRSDSKQIALMEENEELKKNELSELKVIYSDMPEHKIANAYRDLRTKLIQKSQGKNFIVMVTSPTRDNTSTWTTLNLATAFSFDKSKTSLVIDCNLNDAKLDNLLKVNTSTGLTDYLVDEDIDVSTILHPTGIKRLRLIAAGTNKEAATEYFTSSKMRNLMSSLLNRYSDRYIFIDASPITESADTRIIVELCDFVLLVVPYGKTTPNKLKEAADAIGPDKLLGVVFSEIPNIPDL